MPFRFKNILLAVFLLILSTRLIAVNGTAISSTARFIENKGQWPENVLYGVKLGYGMCYIEKEAITFNVYDAALVQKYYEYSHGEGQKPTDEVNAHCFKIKFNNVSNTIAKGLYPYDDYTNFFVGSDSSKWVGNVKIYKEIYLSNYYQGVDLHFYEYQGHLKYDFILQANANANQIEFQCEGIESEIINEVIVFKSSIGDFIQEKPSSFQTIGTIRNSVNNKYFRNEKNNYQFKLDHYDHTLPLIIDPVMVFASFSGSFADNRGFCATYDNAGCLCVGGIAYGSGYITTTGAYKTTYSGGIDDVVISKYSADGSKYLYSTHLGGTGCEQPHSLVVDQNFQLSVFGTTGSTDFPTTTNAYDKSFNGGPNLTLNYYLKFTNGVDIFITKFNASGTALVGSTFVGGNQNDGLNDETFSSGMSYNYGDWFRGEIINDQVGNVIVVTSTSSQNFPISSAFQNTYAGGNHDAVCFKLNNNLSSLLFSTFLGGTDNDAAYSVQLDSKNDIFIAGGTKSSNFPTTPGVLNTNIAGNVDGFITHISSNGGTLKNSTFIGTSSFDQTYFVQLDNSDNVFVLGQTQGTYPITPGTYNNANSKHFIHKLNNTLSSTIFSSTFGANSSLMQMSPTAFLVSDCEDIYVSGWGGKQNADVQKSNYPNIGTLFGSMYGMPVTNDAYQKNTDGNDFYFAVFSKNMKSIKYGTFLGGNTISEHVDGGTSRFDKKGNIYQAVCGGCSGTSDFPVTPGVWSTTNKATNQAQCNEVGIKFSASKLSASIGGIADSILCLNEPTHFINKSDGASSYQWDFGNGDFSAETHPVYTYKKTGHYKIRLVAQEPSGCPPTDTAFINVEVVMPVTISSSVDSVCPGKSAVLTASGATNYQWSPSSTLNKSNGSSVIATPDKSTKYIVSTDSYCDDDTASILLNVASIKHSISPSDSICPLVPFPLSAGPGKNFSWSPATVFNNNNLAAPIAKLSKSMNLHVAFQTIFGCEVNDSVFVKVLPIPNFTMTKDTLICIGESITLDYDLKGSYKYLWSPNSSLSNSKSKAPIANPSNDIKYVTQIDNQCGSTNLFYNVKVSRVQLSVSSQKQICLNDTAQLWAKGGIKYLWSPSNSLSNEKLSNPFAFPTENTTYKVIAYNDDQCSDSAYTEIKIAQNPIKYFNKEFVLEYGENAQITTDEKNIFWSPSTYLNCNQCSSPTVILPEKDITYNYVMYDEQGCSFSDSVKVYVIRKVYVPNAFTPNNDGLNEIFYFRSISVAEFELMIFNRWGELIFTSNNINDGWDGTYKGKDVEIDVYVWKVRYKRNHTSNWESEIGRVSLLR